MLSEDLMATSCEWVNGVGPNADMIISSRIRLARNLSDYVFMPAATDAQRNTIWRLVRDSTSGLSALKEGFVVEMSELSPNERVFLLESHLMSREMTQPAPGRGVIISKDTRLSIMVNEEDHLRIQIVLSGLQIMQSWFYINQLDDQLTTRLTYSFDDKYGYLTACPTNVGTGMRASLLMHLPGLALTKQIKKVLNSLSQLGLTVRGLYGEGSEMKGNLFQISNQITLGRSEMDLLEDLEKTTQHILKSEEIAREVMMKEARQQIEDKIWRAYGILSCARMITSEEVINLSSGIRLGIALGLIKNMSYKQLNEIVLQAQPAHLQNFLGREVESIARDHLRAELIRRRIRDLERHSSKENVA